MKSMGYLNALVPIAIETEKEGGPSVRAALGPTLTEGKPPQRSSLAWPESFGVGIVSAGGPFAHCR